MTQPTETFGHDPVTDDREFFGEVSDDIVCARCWRHVKTWSSYTVGYDDRAGVLWENGWIHYDTRVTWPCTSAIVLGLVPRKPGDAR